MSKMSAGPTPGQAESNSDLNSLQQPDLSSLGMPSTLVYPQADSLGAEVCIINQSVSRIFLLAERGLLPDARKIEQIKARFEIFVELFAAGAAPRFVVEGMIQPVFCDSSSGASDVCEKLNSRASWANEYISIYSRQGLVSAEPVSQVEHQVPRIWQNSSEELQSFKGMIVSAILDRIPEEERRPSKYASSDLQVITEAFDLSIDFIAQAPSLQDPRKMWPLLQRTSEVCSLLMTVGAAPHVIVAGALQGLSCHTACPAGDAGQGELVRKIFEPRVVDLLSALAQEKFLDGGMISTTKEKEFDSPNNQRYETQRLRMEVVAIKCASAISQAFYRWEQSFWGVYVGSIYEQEGAAALAEVGRCFDVLINGEGPKAFLPLYQSRMRLLVREVGEFWTPDSSTMDSLISHQVLAYLFSNTPSGGHNAAELLDRFEHFFDVLLQLVNARVVRPLLIEAMVHPAFDLFEEEIRTAATQLANELKAKKYGSVMSYDFSTAKVSTESHQLQRNELPVFTCWRDFKALLIGSILLRHQDCGHAFNEQDVHFIQLAVKELKSLFLNGGLKESSRGIHESFRHALEVSFVIASSCLGWRDGIVAGLFHDLYEAVPESRLESMRDYISRQFGPRVDQLIAAVTEDRRAKGFLSRKLAVIAKLEALSSKDPELAAEASAIVCASKICTLREGISFFRAQNTTVGWSEGGYGANFTAMCALYEGLYRFDTHPDLITLFQYTLDEWMTAGVEASVATMRPRSTVVS